MSPVRYRDISDYDPGPQHGYPCRGPDYDHVSHDCHAHRACHDDDDDGDDDGGGDDGDQGPQRCPSRTDRFQSDFQIVQMMWCHALNAYLGFFAQEAAEQSPAKS